MSLIPYSLTDLCFHKQSLNYSGQKRRLCFEVHCSLHVHIFEADASTKLDLIATLTKRKTMKKNNTIYLWFAEMAHYWSHGCNAQAMFQTNTRIAACVSVALKPVYRSVIFLWLWFKINMTGWIYFPWREKHNLKCSYCSEKLRTNGKSYFCFEIH